MSKFTGTFGFNVVENPIIDSVFVQQANIGSNFAPHTTEENLVTEGGAFILTEGGDYLDTEQ